MPCGAALGRGCTRLPPPLSGDHSLMLVPLPLGHGPRTAAPQGGTWVRCIHSLGERGLHPKRLEDVAIQAAGTVRGRRGRRAPCLFSDGISGGGREPGDSGGVSGWKRQRCPGRRGSRAAFCLPRDSVTRGIPALPRAVPRLPLPARPAIAPFSPPSPRSQSLRLRICTCGGPSASFPTPSPPHPVLEIGRDPAVPGPRGQAG